MRVTHTYTADFDLETRQHEILGLDLGEGPTRRAVVVGLLLLTLWSGTLLLLFGTPSRYAFSAYFLPPLIVAVYGTQRAGHSPRRWRLTQWALVFRYVMLSHRPIINGGRRAASRIEWIPLRERFSHRTEALATVPGLSALRPTEEEIAAQEVNAGAPLRLNSKLRLYGPDRVYKAHAKQQKKEGR